MKLAFHVVYTLLALNFLVPAAVYALAPDVALESFVRLGELFGASYGHCEDSVLWRVLAVANVATLGFCCVLLQVDLLRFWAALYPLVFLKGMAALGFGVSWLVEPYPGYLGGFLLDTVTVAVIVFFARGARRVLEGA